MSVLAMVVVAQWDEAYLASTPIDDRAWIAHLIARLRQAPVVGRIVVACHPDCQSLVASAVPGGVECVATDDAFAWAAAQGTELVAHVPVWQLFVDPARLTRLADTPRPPGTTLVRAALEGDLAIALTGGVDVELFTAHGLQRAAATADLAGGVVSVPSWPAPPELQLRGPADGGWARALQRALVAAGPAADLSSVEAVMAAAGLCRSNLWREGAATPPRRILTARCLPAALFSWLVAHLSRLPGVRIDVVAPAALTDLTRQHPAVNDVIAFTGPSFEMAALAPDTLADIRARRYDLCVIPRRTACGRGFENITPLGEASSAATAVWMDLTGATGLLAGRAGGWDPWRDETPPWRDGHGLRARARAAFSRLGGEAPPAPEASTEDLLNALIVRMDEAVACHGLLDAPDHGLDLTPTFVHEMPGVAMAREAASQAASNHRSAAARLTTLVDRALVAGVEHLAHAVAGAPAVAAAAAVRHHTDVVAALAAEVVAAPQGSPAEHRALSTLAARTVALHGEGA